MMADKISVQMPARPENTLAIRLLAAGLANLAYFNSEEIEDIKLSVCEACFCTPQGNHTLELSFVLEDEKLSIEIRVGAHPQKALLDFGDVTEEGIGFLLMRNLMDSMEFRTGKEGTVIRLTKLHKSSVPAGSR